MRKTDMRADRSPTQNRIRGMVRQLVVSMTKATGLWQLLGFEGPYGERETFNDVPLFQQIGFSSRPRAGKGEALVVHVGGDEPAIVATRDTEIEVAIAEDETVIRNSKVRVICKADGTVLVDNGAGAQALATKADLDALKAKFTAWVVVPNDGGQALKTLLSGWTPAGTTVLRAS